MDQEIMGRHVLEALSAWPYCLSHDPQAQSQSSPPFIAAATAGLWLQLKVKISKRLAAKEQLQRRKNLTKYIPNAVAAVFPVLESMADNEAVGRKRRALQV